MNRLNIPSSLNILTTKRCNLKCNYCEFSCASKGPFIPKKIFEKIFKEGKRLGIKEYVLDGGEFLIHPQAKEILNLIGKLKIKAVLLTNGLRLNHFLNLLKKNGVNSLIVGLDGISDSVNDTIKGRKGATKTVLENIKKAKQKKFNIGLHLTLSSSNYLDFPKYLRFADQIKAITLLVSNINPIGRGLNKKLALTSLMKKAIARAYQITPHPQKGFFAYKIYSPGFKFPLKQSLSNCKYFSGRVAAIDWNSNLCFCALEPGLEGKSKMPKISLKEHSLKEALLLLEKSHQDLRKKMAFDIQNKTITADENICEYCYKNFAKSFPKNQT